jgi:alcohol dehydrogenase
LIKLDQITAKFRGYEIDQVIGLGGGSAMDTAKILASTLFSQNHNSLEKIFRHGETSSWLKRLNLLLIPTTAGTGAEVTPFATVWDLDRHKKHSIAGSAMYADIAFLDDSLTLTLSEQDTLYPALDCISHALESLWNVNITPISQAYATEALSLANQALPEILKSPESTFYRNSIQNASVLAGLAISQTKTAIAHSISYPLTSHFGVPHGLACSFSLPRLIDYYLSNKSNSPFTDLMKKTKTLLNQLELDQRLLKYVSEDKILSLSQEMFASGRIDNYSEKMPNIEYVLKN